MVKLEADTYVSGGVNYGVCSQDEPAAKIRLPPPQPYVACVHSTSTDVKSFEKSKVQPTEYPYRAKFKRAIGAVSHL
jgi:hypothetical protein